jgi:hypothetical protein
VSWGPGRLTADVTAPPFARPGVETSVPVSRDSSVHEPTADRADCNALLSLARPVLPRAKTGSH